eukprot:11575172-Prorocentrum_lima.AAC.1
MWLERGMAAWSRPGGARMLQGANLQSPAGKQPCRVRDAPEGMGHGGSGRGYSTHVRVREAS